MAFIVIENDYSFEVIEVETFVPFKVRAVFPTREEARLAMQYLVADYELDDDDDDADDHHTTQIEWSNVADFF